VLWTVELFDIPVILMDLGGFGPLFLCLQPAPVLSLVDRANSIWAYTKLFSKVHSSFTFCTAAADLQHLLLSELAVGSVLAFFNGRRRIPAVTLRVLDILSLRARIQVLRIAATTVATLVVDLQLARVSVGQCVAQAMCCADLLLRLSWQGKVSVAVAVAAH
jgi:hypothetical protein